MDRLKRTDTQRESYSSDAYASVTQLAGSPTFNRDMREYMKEVYRRRRHAALKKLGGRCARCGSKLRLEFDHRDPGTKYRSVARMWTYSEKRFWDEVAKCQLLCQVCHQDKSLAEHGMTRAKGVHGTAGNYQHYGCRCESCREANRIVQREYRQRRKRARSSTGSSS